MVNADVKLEEKCETNVIRPNEHGDVETSRKVFELPCENKDGQLNRKVYIEVPFSDRGMTGPIGDKLNSKNCTVPNAGTNGYIYTNGYLTAESAKELCTSTLRLQPETPISESLAPNTDTPATSKSTAKIESNMIEANLPSTTEYEFTTTKNQSSKVPISKIKSENPNIFSTSETETESYLASTERAGFVGVDGNPIMQGNALSPFNNSGSGNHTHPKSFLPDNSIPFGVDTPPAITSDITPTGAGIGALISIVLVGGSVIGGLIYGIYKFCNRRSEDDSTDHHEAGNSNIPLLAGTSTNTETNTLEVHIMELDSEEDDNEEHNEEAGENTSAVTPEISSGSNSESLVGVMVAHASTSTTIQIDGNNGDIGENSRALEPATSSSDSAEHNEGGQNLVEASRVVADAAIPLIDTVSSFIELNNAASELTKNLSKLDEVLLEMGVSTDATNGITITGDNHLNIDPLIDFLNS